MATEHEIFLEQGEIYALGVLEGQELRDFQAHLASGCAICDAHIRETREALTALDRSLNPITPPASVKTRVFETIASKARANVEWRHGSTAWPRWFFVGAVPLAAAATVLFLIWSMTETRKELKELKSQLAAVQRDSAQKNELIELLSAPEVRSIQLAGLAAAPQATGKLFWNPATHRGLLVTFGLPKPTQDKVYELWGIAGDEPVPAGVFLVDEGGETRFAVSQLAKGRTFGKFAVTLEPAGGVTKPSGPMVLLGSL